MSNATTRTEAVILDLKNQLGLKKDTEIRIMLQTYDKILNDWKADDCKKLKLALRDLKVFCETEKGLAVTAKELGQIPVYSQQKEILLKSNNYYEYIENLYTFILNPKRKSAFLYNIYYEIYVNIFENLQFLEEDIINPFVDTEYPFENKINVFKPYEFLENLASETPEHLKLDKTLFRVLVKTKEENDKEIKWQPTQRIDTLITTSVDENGKLVFKF